MDERLERAALILHNRSPKCYDAFGNEEECRCVSKAREAVAAYLGDDEVYVRRWSEHADDSWPGQYEYIPLNQEDEVES